MKSRISRDERSTRRLGLIRSIVILRLTREQVFLFGLRAKTNEERLPMSPAALDCRLRPDCRTACPRE